MTRPIPLLPRDWRKYPPDVLARQAEAADAEAKVCADLARDHKAQADVLRAYDCGSEARPWDSAAHFENVRGEVWERQAALIRRHLASLTRQADA